MSWFNSRRVFHGPGLPLVKLGEISQFVVLSDVHLRNPNSRSTQVFCTYLNGLTTSIHAVFLLGDIFDFIYVGSAYHVSLWQPVFTCLESLRKRGIRVYFLEGNHDFGFAHALPNKIANCFDAVGDVVFQLSHPTLGEVVLRHGDDIVCPPSYPPFRRLVKSAVFQKTTGLVPGAFTYWMFSRYAQISRKTDKYRTLSQDFLKTCLSYYFKCLPQKMNVLIIGHIHVDLNFEFEDVTFYSGPDWFAKPSALVCDADGKIERNYI